MQQARLTIVTVTQIIIMKTEVSPMLFSSMVIIFKTLQDVTLILVMWTTKCTFSNRACLIAWPSVHPSWTVAQTL